MRLFVCTLVLALAAKATAVDLTGRWEVQSIGADRELTIEQRGNKIVAHRVLWPEFEGQKCKLEHLYRGKLNGAKISGDLLVREETQKEYEFLRHFVGEIGAHGELNFDGLPLKRIETTPPIDPKASPQGPATAPPAPASAPKGAPAAGSRSQPTQRSSAHA